MSVAAIKEQKGKSLWSEGWVRLKKNKAAMISLWIIVVTCIMAIFANQLSPFPFDEQDIDNILVPPNATYLFGTDNVGRDLLSRIIYGARMSMAVGIITAIISLVLGGIYGMISGWAGGKTDEVMMRIIDVLYAIPSIVLLILVKVIFESMELFDNPELRALTGVLLALSVVGWVTLARVVRGQVLQVKEMPYVEAAKSMGARSPWILMKHVAPNILGPVIVLLTFQVPSNILYESILSFIGLGLQPPFSSWGVLAKEGYDAMSVYPHLMITPCIVMSIVILAFNLFGDGLRDAFDPKLKK